MKCTADWKLALNETKGIYFLGKQWFDIHLCDFCISELLQLLYKQL